jgi:myo-inositol-1(or 4)-monophosphatase
VGAGWTLPADEERVTLEQLAVSLATEAGRFVRDERPDVVSVAETKATVLDVVTVMDTRCESLLRERIAAARPDDGILGEEDGLSPGTSGLTWVLDPIDGTVNYLYDLPAYAVSVAVVVGDPTVPGGWSPVAGAVCNPRVDEVFHARAGGGARLDRPTEPGGTAYPRGRALAVREPESLARTLLATGFSYDVDDRRAQGDIAVRMLTQVRDLRRMGAASLDLCHVAAGRVDAYYERGLQPWDMAAGMLVVTEAGGVVSGLDGPASRDMVVAAAPQLHAALHPVLVELHR